jgi:hypothetical protein
MAGGAIRHSAPAVLIPPRGTRGEGRRARASRGGGVHGKQDAHHHPIQISIHVRIPESQDLESSRSKEGIALTIRWNTSIDAMMTAVDLDDHSTTERGEVDNVAADWRLPSKMKPEFFQFTQLHPYFHFLRRQSFAKRPGILDRQWESPYPNLPHPTGLRPATLPALRRGGIKKAATDQRFMLRYCTLTPPVPATARWWISPSSSPWRRRPRG